MGPTNTPSCDCPHRDRGSSDSRVPRRAVLACVGAAGAASVAGCLGGDTGASSEAISVTDAASCDECGMVISNHPGPNGEIYWADADPEGHDAPFWFDSLKQCFFPHYFEGTDRGQELAAAYVTDYSAVDYDVSTKNGESYITSHTDADAFGPAKDLDYVVESEVTGAMGPDFVPFGDESDATAFADEYDGTVVAFADVKPALTGK